MSLKIKVMALVLTLVATVAAVKLVRSPADRTPYGTAFRVTSADAIAECAPFKCIQGHCYSEEVHPTGCNARFDISGNPYCGPVKLCFNDPPQQ